MCLGTVQLLGKHVNLPLSLLKLFLTAQRLSGSKHESSTSFNRCNKAACSRTNCAVGQACDTEKVFSMSHASDEFKSFDEERGDLPIEHGFGLATYSDRHGDFLSFNDSLITHCYLFEMQCKLEAEEMHLTCEFGRCGDGMTNTFIQEN